MKQFLTSEGRFKFRVERYWKTICGQNTEMNANLTADDLDSYGRTLYLLRKSIYSEFKYLRTKRMSPADCVITIIHKILDYSEKLGEFKFSKEQKIIKEVIDSLWGNIKHNAKNLGLKNLSNRLNMSIEGELHGTLCYNDLNLDDVENPKPKEQVLKKETQFYQDVPKTMEITL